MKRKYLMTGLAAGAMALSGLAAVVPAATGSPAQTASGIHTTRVCAAHPRPGYMSCMAIAVSTATGRIAPSATPSAAGFTPSDIQAAYGLTGLKSHGRTVAIVDAFGYSTLESDLATFRSQYGLSACTTKNGCLTIMNQNGGKKLPKDNQGWDLEQALDVDAVSSACPDCKIVVVESKTNSGKNLMIAEDTAAKQKGVSAISNSWGGGNGKDQAAFDHPGIAITASTGDNGYQGGMMPASDSKVVAVGGTSVYRSSAKRGYTESAWTGAGSGCGKNKTPKWQKKVDTTCKTKAMADVSAAADPGNGGLNIYDTGYGGWIQVGGTSESSPLIAAVFTLSGKTKGYPAKYVYSSKAKKHLYDITSGSNGTCGPPLCEAGKGWDGPTGMGTPDGVKAF